MITYDGGSEDGRYFYHFDALGSVVALSQFDTTPGDGYASLVEQYTYTAFGETTVCDAGGTPRSTNVTQYGNPYMFTGRRWDAETGLYYYRARVYSPYMGRFLQPDPIGYADSMNLYGYVGNNPIKWMDSLGLCRSDRYVEPWTIWDDIKSFHNYLNDSATVTLSRMTLGGYDLLNDFLGYQTADDVLQRYPEGEFFWSSEVPGYVAGGSMAAAGTMAALGVDVVLWGGGAAASNPDIQNTVGNTLTGFQGSIGYNQYHALDRAIERGVSPQAILETLNNPVTTIPQGDRTVYLSDVAAVILDSTGQMVTTWGASDHSQQVLQILENAKNASGN